MRVADADAGAVFSAPDRLLLVRQGNLIALRFDPSRDTVSGDPTLVAESVSSVMRGAFSASGQLLAYRAGLVDRRRLAWLDRTGRQIGTLGAADETHLSSPEIAPDRRRVLVTRFIQGNVDVWSVDAASGVSTRLTFSPSAKVNPVWSPDGRTIAFNTTVDGRSAIHLQSMIGADNERPLDVPGRQPLPFDWSPDGRFLLYQVQDSKTGGDLWVAPVNGGAAEPIANTPFEETGGQFSPDAQWIAYQSDASGQNEIYVRSFRGPGQPMQVSRGGGTEVRWRRDGREIFYLGSDGRLTAVSVTPRGRALEFAQPAALFALRTATGTNIAFGRAQYTVTSDGRFVAVVAEGDAAPPPISIVFNWPGASEER
jgi:Tol biopolymer transport system component